MIVTWEEALAAERAEGRAVGKVEGRVEGRVAGKVEGRVEGATEGELRAKRADVVFILTHRFGSLPAGLEKRLERITDLERLQVILERALSVDSMEGFRLEP